ncbi:MAG: sodium-dependent transporter, partial [Deltaproteobacteria bacterium HGW-Deltaproteobacteria-24]
MHTNRFTRVGFILAAAGSAVGLGNIWKFPYITGENGGGVFVLIYLATVVFIGMSVFIGEVLLGSNAHKDAVSTFETLSPKKYKYWKYSGFTFLTGVLILSFYAVVVGWIFHYVVVAATALPSSVQE